MFIFRDHKWYLRELHEKQFTAQYGPSSLTWKGPSIVKVNRIDSPRPTRARGPAERVRRNDLPAQLIEVEVDTAPIKSIVSAFTASAGYTVTVPARLENRRVSAHIRRTTPGQFLEALTFLLNASQQVAIFQSEGQRREEAELLAQLMDDRSQDQKMTDELLPDLLKILKPDQVAALNSGDRVPIALGSLPDSLHQRVSEYVDYCSNNRAKGYELDTSRSREFSIVILPPPSTALGVGAFLKDGTPIHF